MKTHKCASGYAIASVLIFSVVLSATAAVLLKYCAAEFLLNQRNQLRFQAKNGAEAMLEYGASEIMGRLAKNLNFSDGELTSNPLATPAARKGTLFATGSGTYNNVASSSLQFWASKFTEPTIRTIDASDPGNAYDPLRGQKVRTQLIRLLAKATSTTVGVSSTQYATQSIEIRDANMFNYAIFYNIPMEFHPGPDMTVIGPVHANQNVYMTSNNGKTLKFLASVTTAAKFYNDQSNPSAGRTIARNVEFTNGLDTNLDNTPDTIGITSSTIKNGAGTLINTASGDYVDSNLENRKPGNTFAQIASQVWNGNVQDSTMGVRPQLLPGIPDRETETQRIAAGRTVEQSEAIRIAKSHTIIEKPDTSTPPTDPTLLAERTNLEKQKYSKKAGLYVFQAANSGSAPPDPVVFKTADDANTYRALTTAQRVTWLTDSANRDKIIKLPDGVLVKGRTMYDRRQSSWVSTIDVDAGKLKTAINTTTNAVATNVQAWNGTTYAPTDANFLESSVSRNGIAENLWNGVLYVEVENPLQGYSYTPTTAEYPNGGSTVDTPLVARVGTRTAVRLVNAAEVPNRNAVASGTTDGFTLATNAPVYTIGNINSPGPNAGTRGGTAVGTESDVIVNTPKDGESPVSIAADAIYILSNTWGNGTNNTPLGDLRVTTTTSGGVTTANVNSPVQSPNASTTEVAAAILAGIVATSGSNYSGGVENFPRFLENWSSVKFRYRGSMVALFNSTVATAFVDGGAYSPPTRVWGFNKMFQDGRQPPGTPRLRSFRRLVFADLTESQFNTLKNNATLGFTEM